MTDTTIPSEASVVIAAWPGLDLVSLVGDDVTIGRGTRLGDQRWTLDTVDQRLARADIVVSRDDAGWTVRCGTYGTRTFDGAEPAPELLAALAGVSRGATLAVGTRLRRQGRSMRVSMVVDEGTQVVGTISDEDVSTLDGRRVVAKQRYVTVSGTPGLVGQVRRAVAVAGMERRVVNAIPDVPPAGPADPRPWPLEERPLAGTVVQRSLARSVAKLIAHDPVVRLDLHVEGVHQMRVALRRLRSDLATFADVVGPLPAGLEDDLRWLGGLLGGIRDLDVLDGTLATAIATLEPADARSTNSLVKRLRRQREAGRAPLEQALASDRYRAMIDALVDLAERPPFTTGADGCADEVLIRSVRTAWRKLAKSARAAHRKDAVIEDVHALRLRAKRFRYALDALADVEGAAKRQARLVGGLQDVLGRLNDAATAEAWLRDQAAHEEDPKRTFALGQLVAHERSTIAACRREWPSAWRPVRRRPARAWLSD